MKIGLLIKNQHSRIIADCKGSRKIEIQEEGASGGQADFANEFVSNFSIVDFGLILPLHKK